MEKKVATPKKTVAKTVKPVADKAAEAVKVVDKAEVSDKVKTTASNVNNEIIGTANEIVENVKEMGQELKKVAETTTKNVAEATKKVDVKESVNKVKTTANNVNTQIVNTANEILDDVKEMTEGIKDVATKGLKEAAKKIDMKESVNKAKATAQSVNKQLMETAVEIVEDAKEKATKMTEEVKTKTAKMAKEAVEAVENIDVTGAVKNIGKSAAKANEAALNASDELIDSLVANAEKWQDLTEKAIKSGLKLSERQQAIVFSTLEAMKTQVSSSSKQFRKLFQKA